MEIISWSGYKPPIPVQLTVPASLDDAGNEKSHDHRHYETEDRSQQDVDQIRLRSKLVAAAGALAAAVAAMIVFGVVPRHAGVSVRRVGAIGRPAVEDILVVGIPVEPSGRGRVRFWSNAGRSIPSY